MTAGRATWRGAQRVCILQMPRPEQLAVRRDQVDILVVDRGLQALVMIAVWAVNFMTPDFA